MALLTDPHFPLRGRRIFVAGHRGMVGAAIVRRLRREDCEILTVDRQLVDLRQQASVDSWIGEARPDVVFLAAATVGGILANDTYPATFMYDNLAIETNVIEAARRVGVKKLLFLGSSCIYPKLAPQPIPESALLTGPLEPTNEWYSIAKIAGLKMCQAYRRQYQCDFISVMPTNLYGPGDNFDLRSSHVLPALIMKMHRAKLANARAVTLFGSGNPRRELLHVDDLADACVFLMQNYSAEQHVNIGTGEDATIADLARLVAEIVGFRGHFEWDRTKPDGTPRKLLDVGKLHALGWRARIDLPTGVEQVYAWFLEHQAMVRGACA